MDIIVGIVLGILLLIMFVFSLVLVIVSVASIISKEADINFYFLGIGGIVGLLWSIAMFRIAFIL